MNAETIYKGIVTYFSIERHFGFIDSELQEDIFFFIDTMQIRKMKKEGLALPRKVFFNGDEVYFKVRNSTKGSSGLEAFDLRYIQNEKIDEMLSLIREEKPLTGYIKKLDDGYYVKDKQTYLFIPIEISDWETGNEYVYEHRINELVNYRVERIPKHQKNIKAILPDRIFSSTYHQLLALKENRELITVRITGKRKGGYFGAFLNNTVDCFIIVKEEQDKPGALKTGDIVACRIKYINLSKVVQMELAREIE